MKSFFTIAALDVYIPSNKRQTLYFFEERAYYTGDLGKWYSYILKADSIALKT